MQWPPWQKAPQPPPVDITALARQVAEETVAQVTAELNRAAFESPLAPVGSKAPGIYAFDQPWQFYTPQAPTRRPGSYVTVDTLRQLARSYDVLRSCIQHQKREVAAVPIKITARDAKDDSKSTLRSVKDAESFFEVEGGLGGPGRRRTHFESEVLEEVMVVGAGAVFFSQLRGGGLEKAEAIDASTIRPRVDAYGWPGPGEIAYEQWIMGVQTGPGYTREQLLYDGLNPVANSPYFVSPVEWLIGIVNGAIRADAWNLAWLTDGSQPDQIISLPDGWTPDQVVSFAQYWDGMLGGNTKQRRKTRFVPGGTSQVGTPTRKDQDFQEYELWLMRRCCGIMGVAPAAIGFAGEQYKVSQEGSIQNASQIGSGQLLEFRKHLYDEVLRRLGYPDLECQNVTNQEEGAAERADRNTKLVAGGIKTPNEARQDEGLDGYGEAGDVLLVSNTLVPLEQAVKPPEPSPTAPPAADSATSSQDDPEPPGNGFQLLGDQQRSLRQWEKKALNRLKDGRSASCPFVAEALNEALVARVEDGLKLCDSAQSVRNLFAKVIELGRGADQPGGAGGGNFEESEHPRDQGGKFGSKGGGKESAKSSGGGNGGAASTGKDAGAATAAVDASPETRTAANKYFGREVSDADFQKLLGSPAGSKVHVDARADGGLIFHVEHSSFEQQHRAQCMKKPDGTPFMLLDLYHLKDETPEGAGTRAFNQMVQHGREMGLDAIVIPEAARTSRGMVGYYVWPRLGAQGPLPEDVKKDLPESLKGAKELSDVMETQEGRDWWKDKGKTVFCYFKLAEDSGSSKMLAGYMKEKGYE